MKQCLMFQDIYNESFFFWLNLLKKKNDVSNMTKKYHKNIIEFSLEIVDGISIALLVHNSK